MFHFGRSKGILFMIIVGMFLFTGCMSSQDRTEVDAIIGEIDSIGQVTLEKENIIIELEERYQQLSDKQKELVTNYWVLTEANIDLAALIEQEQLRIQREEEEAKKEALRIQQIQEQGHVLSERLEDEDYEWVIQGLINQDDEFWELNGEVLRLSFQQHVQLNTLKSSYVNVLQETPPFHQLMVIGEILSDNGQECEDTMGYIQRVLDFEQTYLPYDALIQMYESDELAIITGTIINSATLLEPENWTKAKEGIVRSIAIIERLSFEQFGLENEGIQQVENLRLGYLDLFKDIIEALDAFDLPKLNQQIASFQELSLEVLGYNEQVNEIINAMKEDLETLK